MKFKYLFITFITVIITLFTSNSIFAEEYIDAKNNKMKVLINNKENIFITYLIEDNNYIKLRDIAVALNETESKFNVVYNYPDITIFPGESYINTENNDTNDTKDTNDTDAKARLSNLNIKSRDNDVYLKAYNINGYNYFKLRDLADICGFNISYDNDIKLVKIEDKEKQLTDKEEIEDKEKQLTDKEEIEVIFNKVNEEREKQGLDKLILDESLMKAANVRAQELSEKYSHTRPNGESCFSILEENNIEYSTAGENIALGYITGEDVMDGWMNSKGHRENILNPMFNKIGIGKENEQWVQMFIGD